MPAAHNIGLSQFAQMALAATALAPVLLVWAAAAYKASPIEAGAAVAVSALLVIVCAATLAFARRELQTEPLVVKKATRLDKEALAFLVTYALPLIVPNDQTNLAALAVFVGIVGVVLVQLQILHVNPLLGILGFHFYEIENVDGDTSLVVSRSRQLPRATVSGQRLGPALWIL